MASCKNCENFDDKINGKQFISMGFCKRYNMLMRRSTRNLPCFKQRRYFQVTRDERK